MRPTFDLLVPPPVPEENLARGSLRLRYEDIAQDGSLALSVLSAGLGASVWEKLLAQPAARTMRDRGEIPILTRLVLAAGEGPISVADPLRMDGCFRFSHARLPSGEVDRILVEMWSSASAPRGSTYGPPSGPDAQVVTAGRLYAEHVLTRLFAPKEDRKIRRIELPSMPEVPGPEVPWVPPAKTAELFDGARPLGDTTSAKVAFGFTHTDANQHVNSLVYLRMAEDAALQRLASLGRDTQLVLDTAELAYRKPSFVGDVVSLELRAFESTHEGQPRLGVVGGFVDEGKPFEQARTFVRLTFR
jgi:hypothetical protein